MDAEAELARMTAKYLAATADLDTVERSKAKSEARIERVRELCELHRKHGASTLPIGMILRELEA